MAKDHCIKTCAFRAPFSMLHELKMFQVVIECVLGLLFGIAGASLKAPPLKEITWASEMQKRYDSIPHYISIFYSSQAQSTKWMHDRALRAMSTEEKAYSQDPYPTPNKITSTVDVVGRVMRLNVNEFTTYAGDNDLPANQLNCFGSVQSITIQSSAEKSSTK
jgi:hypothetical protein